MLKYKYKAKNNQGEEKEDTVEASNEREVAEMLRADGYWIVSLKEIEEKKKSAGNFINSLMMKVPLKTKMIFCRHLAVMITSGVTISKALMILGEQEKNKVMKKVILKVTEDVKKGMTLADSIEKYPGIFNSIFVSMVRVGETSGNLEKILKILSQQLEKDNKLVSKVRGAMMYPSVVVCVMLIIGVLMMMFVIPKITTIFADFDTELPIMTKIVIVASDFVSHNSIITLAMMFGFAGFIFFFYRTSIGTRIFHKIFLKAPIIGAIVVKVNSARFARILSSLLESGVSLVKALQITANTLGNFYFKKAIEHAGRDVQKGIELSKVMASHKNTFPYLVIQMVEVGEETGKTPEILLKLAGFYEEEVDQTTKNLSSIIEPILMVTIGAAVGFFAIAVIQPIYSIMEKI